MSTPRLSHLPIPPSSPAVASPSRPQRPTLLKRRSLRPLQSSDLPPVSPLALPPPVVPLLGGVEKAEGRGEFATHEEARCAAASESRRGIRAKGGSEATRRAESFLPPSSSPPQGKRRFSSPSLASLATPSSRPLSPAMVATPSPLVASPPSFVFPSPPSLSPRPTPSVPSFSPPASPPPLPTRYPHLRSRRSRLSRSPTASTTVSASSTSSRNSGTSTPSWRRACTCSVEYDESSTTSEEESSGKEEEEAGRWKVTDRRERGESG